MNPTILFVDDELPIRELLSLYLRKKGFNVIATATATEARELIDQGRFDLAILDVNLAGESGFDLLGLIKSRHPGLPVIIFTGLEVDDALVKKAYAGRADGFMHKSVSLNNLLAEVRRLLPA